MLWRPKEHEQLTLEGDWGVYNGDKEFSFVSARLDIPTNPRDQLHYVCLRTPGCGPAMEDAIWAKRGADWQNIAENEVTRLRGTVYANFMEQIGGLSGKQIETHVVATLMGKGASQNMAVAAWAMWKGETLGVVNADPFRLAELPNYSFRDVDRMVRPGYGIADDDMRRIRAGVVYSLRRLTDGGDTVVQWQELFSSTVGMLGGYAELVSEATGELLGSGALKAFEDSEGVCLAEDWNAEVAIWAFVNNNKEQHQ